MAQIIPIVDGNSVGYAEHYATKLKSGELETQAVFGFIRKMRELKTGYPGCRPLVLWDGRAQWRFDLWPQYKSNRDNDPKKAKIKEAYVAQRPFIARAIEHLGIRQLTALDAEADDMAGHLTNRLAANPEVKVVLFTGDHDWIQLIRENVVWRDVKDPANLIKPANLLDKTGYKTPLAFLEGKCLQGDTSDVIPGVGGIGEGTAPQFLAQWGSVGSFLKAVDSGAYVPAKRKAKNAKTPHPEEFLASRDGRAAFLRNLKLMQLLNVAQPDPARVKVVPGALDRDKFAALCEELAFFSILKDLDNWLAPFEA